MKRIINYFTDNDLYTFTCQYYVLQNYPRAIVEYSFFDRNNMVYPKGFAEELRHQAKEMENIHITNKECDFLLNKCGKFLPEWYINVFLKGFRFDSSKLNISQDEDGYLSINFIGPWYEMIMWEMPLLSTISELYSIMSGAMQRYDSKLETERIYKKANAILSKDGFKIADMGTRRRFSFEHQETVIMILSMLQKSNKNSVGKFIGTSNVYFAMMNDITPIGTMSHQIASFEEIVSGVRECNTQVMEKWSNTYNGNNGIYLYDCFGDDIFFANMPLKMAMLYSGLRVDSGNELEQTQRICEKYKEFGIDPRSKQVVYSNGLNLEKAFNIHDKVSPFVQDSYGIGTFLTHDVKCARPLNIVIKLTKGSVTEKRAMSDCVKLSCSRGKITGNKEKCEMLQRIIDKESK